MEAPRPASSPSASIPLPSARRVALVSGAVALAFASLLLSGCAGVADRFRDRDGTTFQSYVSASSRWSADPDIPSWIPADSSTIHVLATQDRSQEVVYAETAGAPAGDCTAAQLDKKPKLAAAWSPEKLPDDVSVCGHWTVVAHGDGLFGWRNSPEPDPVPASADAPTGTGAPAGTNTPAR